MKTWVENDSEHDENKKHSHELCSICVEATKETIEKFERFDQERAGPNQCKYCIYYHVYQATFYWQTVFMQAKHKCDALPEGWFYNGTTYVNLTGEKSTHHPCILLNSNL